jgi:mannose-6-phosphate isomerase-like protein (cupin superfamily)
MSSIPLSKTIAAIDVLHSHFERRQTGFDALATELGTVLTHLRAVKYNDGILQGNLHPVAQYLGGKAPSKSKPLADVLNAFRPLADALPWRYSYSPRPDKPGLENSMAWAELVGPNAPFHSNHVCLGITVIGPHVHYPEHKHPAVEVYYVLSGTARWTAKGITKAQPPGAYILHPANVVHVMETDDEPLIAAYTWSGEVQTLSVYSD